MSRIKNNISSKQTQSERILEDLLLGIHVNMLDNVKRYGTSCRSRISELRANGYPIEDYFVDNYKVYFLPESYLNERKLKVTNSLKA